MEKTKNTSSLLYLISDDFNFKHGFDFNFLRCFYNLEYASVHACSDYTCFSLKAAIYKYLFYYDFNSSVNLRSLKSGSY